MMASSSRGGGGVVSQGGGEPGGISRDTLPRAPLSLRGVVRGLAQRGALDVGGEGVGGGVGHGAL